MEDSIKQFTVTMKQIMHISADIEELETFILAASEMSMPSEKLDVLHLEAFFGGGCLSDSRASTHWNMKQFVESGMNVGKKEEQTGEEADDSSSGSSTDDSDSELPDRSSCPTFPSGDDGENDEAW